MYIRKRFSVVKSYEQRSFIQRGENVMIEEKKKVKSPKRIIWIFIGIYFLVVAGYYLGKGSGEGIGLEYRFWVDACFRIWVWFVPILFVGVLLLKTCIRLWQKQSPWRWPLSLLAVVCGGGALYFSFFYFLFCGFTMTSDERMPDGNLVVAVPSSMESVHHYAEPVGLFFRREFTFDEERTAESLSKIYGVTFRALREENGQWFYGSEAYPEIEVSDITYGFRESNYLDNNFNLALTGKMLEEHQEVFVSQGIELVPYIFGRSEENPEGKGIYTAVSVSEENKEQAAEAIAEFIKKTLKEDLRPDGKSIWDCVDGSIFLVTGTEDGGYKSIWNISFALKPEYTWFFDENVTASEITEEIVIQNELELEKENGLQELVGETTEIPESAEPNIGTEEISKEIQPPSKEEVLAARKTVTEGMTEEEIARLTENIKVANSRMEYAYFYEDLFGRLEDPRALYWNYFDCKGDIQIGWSYDGSIAEQREICQQENLTTEAFYEKYGTPVMTYNRFHGENFIALLEDMKSSVTNDALIADIDRLIEETRLATETHDVVHANNIFQILHDMDYFLLRYGIEDVGKYIQDASFVAKYYGTLSIYNVNFLKKVP